MTAALSTPHSKDKAPERRLPQRPYVFVVTALAVFFVGLVVWRVPISSYSIRAQIGCDVPRGNNADVPRGADSHLGLAEGRGTAADLMGNVTTPEQLRDAVDFANSQAPAPVHAPGNALRNAEVKSLIKHLEANIREIHGDLMTVELRFESPHREWAVAFLNRLAQGVVRPAKPTAAAPLRSNRELREARWRLDEARHYERKAQFDVENFVDDHFEQIAGEALDSPGEDALTINNSDTDQGVAPSISVPQLNTAPGASEEVNPERDRLERDLATALVRRDGLMRQFTSDHPQVQDLTLQVEDLQQRLASFPSALPATASSTAPSSSPFPVAKDLDSPEFPNANAGAPGGTAAVAESSLISAGVEQYLVLRERLHRATEGRELAEESYEEQLDLRTVSKPAASKDIAARWIVSPAEVVGHSGGNLPAVRVLVIGVASVACGLLMAWAAGSLHALLRINSLDDIETLTELPIVGQLSLDPTSVDGQRLATRHRLVQWGTLGCEVTLGLLVLTFVATVMADSPSFSQFADDPFGIFAETIAQACRARL